MNKPLLVLLISISLFAANLSAKAQGFTTQDYKKALWMTTRMYGGQRSGENNWLVSGHLPSGVAENLRGKCFSEDKDTDGYDISGGWHDCGDHVKYGQTQFYSAYMLLKAYAEFPTGYDDYYSYTYNGYKTAGDWSWEGKKHDPNGIPDILDEVKHATDYFIKCTRNATTFYYQVGNSNYDHQEWVTAVKMQTSAVNKGGQQRPVYKNPNDASMPSFCGATLALMSRMYRPFDPAYADLCLQHALFAYTYAKAHPGTAATGEGGFYGANYSWKDDYATMCTELFWATNTESYKTEAFAFTIAANNASAYDISGKTYGFDYENNGDIAIYNLALLGRTNAKSTFGTIVNSYLTNVQADGQFAGGNTSWGPLRYNANTALMVALWQKLNGTDATPHKFIYDNIDYILGKNSSNLSFIVGFGSKSPLHPHHRNLFLRDDNPTDAIKMTFPIPTKNKQAGYMVGGTRNAGSFSDDLVNVLHTEGGIDYNACLVGVLAFINSKLDPVNTAKFGKTTPDLGENQSICGKTSHLLHSKVAIDNVKTFTWYKDGVIISPASTSKNTLTVTQAGVYKCRLDSLTSWFTEGSVEILGVLPAVNLGADQELCSITSVTLDLGVSGTGITYSWTKDGKAISSATSQKYTATQAGTYVGTISASGCASKSDNVVITSKLLSVASDTICEAGKANLKVNAASGVYDWYDASTGGSSLATGLNYSPSITSSKTYYVQDGNSISANAGPSSTSNTLASPQNGGSIGIKFTASRAFTITQMKILPFVFSCNNGDLVKVIFDLKQNGVVIKSFASVGIACTGTQSNAPFNTFYTFNFDTPIEVPSAGSYELTPPSNLPNGYSQIVWFESGANFSTMDAAGVMDITDDTRDDKATSFPGIFDIKIQAGNACSRTPVYAVIDAQNPNCGVVSSIDGSVSNKLVIFPNPSSSEFIIEAPENSMIRIYDELGRMAFEANSNGKTTFGEQLSPGFYHVVLFQEGKMINSGNIIKQ
ncbi:glycoside hydrolase family 9 protein [Sporocytophaga myxococcoides]|uniref:glycoside hydrolase family 9 protein n=1 Tax=Sporocytophaga myxococcoides TaxID=153721 RepID=UPI00041183F7|nr:glycoside hydrolase family 9 protein [Sporocytophaga myxococcoides]